MEKIVGTDLDVRPVIFLYPPWGRPKSKQFNSNIFHQLLWGPPCFFDALLSTDLSKEGTAVTTTTKSRSGGTGGV